MVFGILIFVSSAECKMTHPMIHSLMENPGSTGFPGFLEIYDQVFVCCVYGFIQIYSV